MKSIRILKTEKNSPNLFGCINPKWEPSHYIVNFACRPFVDIIEGEVFDKETNKPVPITDLLKALVAQNRLTVENRAQGRSVKQQFTAKWAVDFHPELEPLFQELGLPIPADRKSQGERLKQQLLGNLAMQGVITTGLEESVAPGAKAIYEAKLKAEQEELAALKAEKAALESEVQVLKETKAKKQKIEV